MLLVLAPIVVAPTVDDSVAVRLECGPRLRRRKNDARRRIRISRRLVIVMATVVVVDVRCGGVSGPAERQPVETLHGRGDDSNIASTFSTAAPTP